MHALVVGAVILVFVAFVHILAKSGVKEAKDWERNQREKDKAAVSGAIGGLGIIVLWIVGVIAWALISAFIGQGIEWIFGEVRNSFISEMLVIITGIIVGFNVIKVCKRITNAINES